MGQDRWPLAVLQDTGEESIDFNVPAYYELTTVRISGELDRGKMAEAIRETIRNNDALQLDLREEEGQFWLCRRPSDAALTLDYRDLAESCETVDEAEEMAHEQMAQLMQEGPVSGFSSGFTLFRLEEEDYLFLFVISHIVMDGGSSDYVLQEICARYNGEPVQEKEADFGDYLDELMTEEHSLKRKKMQEYCQKLRQDYRECMIWPEDNRAQESAVPILFLETEKMRALAKKRRTTSFALSLFAYHAAIAAAFDVKDTMTFFTTGEREKRYRYTPGMFAQSILNRIVFREEEQMTDALKRAVRKMFDNMQWAHAGFNLNALPSFVIASQNFVGGGQEMRFGNAVGERFFDNSMAPPAQLNMFVLFLMQQADTTIVVANFDETAFAENWVARFTRAFETALLVLEEEDVTFAQYLERI